LAVLDFNPENHHSFQFRLGDEDEEWVDLGSRHEITFMDLEPGTHQFIARGQNCQGVWNTLATPLTIHVRPPWWMTLWFRLGVLVAVIGMILGFHLFRTSALRRHNLELLELHKQREQAQARLGEAYDRLRKLTRRLEAAKEEERHRIARELHDEMGPALTAVIINLQLIEGTLDREKTARWITDSIEIADRMVQQVRDLSLALRPPLLDEVGLLSAVRAYLESQAERTGLEIMIEAPETIDTLPPEIEITAFRVIQEAVSNVIRHAHAQTIEVRLKREADGVTLVIRDDGIGFEAASALAGAAPGSALGLLGMQERVRALGGSFEINSSRRQGTSVTVHLPMEVH
jgi:signal transduction histidine kinase